MELESPTEGQSQALPQSTCILQQEEAHFSHPSMKKDFFLAKPYEKPLGFPCGLADKEPDCNAGDLGLIAGLGRSPGEGKGYPLHYSDLEKSMDCIVCGVAESDKTGRLFTSPSCMRSCYSELPLSNEFSFKIAPPNFLLSFIRQHSSLYSRFACDIPQFAYPKLPFLFQSLVDSFCQSNNWLFCF